MLPPKQEAAFQELVARAHDNDLFSREQTILLFLAAAMASRCRPCIHRFLGEAQEQGIDEKAVGLTTAIAMCVRAGGVRASLLELMQTTGE